MQRLSKAAMAMLAVCVGASVLIAPASAGKTVETTISLRLGDIKQPPLFGRVSSDDPACRQGRRVLIVMVSPRRGLLDYADHRTNARGKWRFSSQLQGGRSFKAQVKPRKVDGVSCGAATSPVKSFSFASG
ncbi:MAG: hypothetical protein M3M99_02865 [Actinomycetota bacterium]|nr:hypothetical protein [Actinomycetota bacterium]